MSQFREPGSENPFTFMLDEAFTGLLRSLMICLPGRIVGFDPATQRAQVECGVQRLVNGQRGITIPVIENVPVQFAGDSEWYHFHQITPGQTEGLIHFTQRAADVWINQGGPSAPTDFRLFDAKDAFFSPGYRSGPRAIPSFPNDGAGISNYAGDVRIHAQDGIITMTAGGSTITIDASGVTIGGAQITNNGNTTINGNIGVTGTMQNDGTNVGRTHTHPQGNDSAGDSQQNTGRPQ